MRLMDRNLNRAEKALLLVLSLLLVVLAYYQFVHKPIEADIGMSHLERIELENELLGVQKRLAQMKKMKDELDRVGVEGDRMESYNNSKAEIALLNSALADAQRYSITFTDISRDDDQIRRNFTMEFYTDSFEHAQRIITKLTESEYRCLLGDMTYECTRSVLSGEAQSVRVELTATFYETMVGGTPDAGLPQNEPRSIFSK